jgi:hypothetical protein
MDPAPLALPLTGIGFVLAAERQRAPSPRGRPRRGAPGHTV